MKLKDGTSNKKLHLKIIHLEKVDSTNTYAYRLAERGADHGTIVWADEQTDGRGQFNRKWFSEPKKDLLASIIVRPQISPKNASKITLDVAKLIKKELESIYGLKGRILTIKAPNDLLFKKRKICGILTESSSKGNKLQFVVIGIGLNLNSNPSKKIANSTSFYEELLRIIKIDRVLLSISKKIVQSIL